MVIDVTHQFNILVSLFVLVAGLDFAVSGFCIFRDKSSKHIPKFIGFLFLKLLEKNEKILVGRKYSKKPLTRLARSMFNLKAFGYYFFISGLLLIIASLLQLLSFNN